jgi:hypothetical protein
VAAYPTERLSSVHTAAIFGDGYVMKRMAAPSRRSTKIQNFAGPRPLPDLFPDRGTGLHQSHITGGAGSTDELGSWQPSVPRSRRI